MFKLTPRADRRPLLLVFALIVTVIFGGSWYIHLFEETSYWLILSATLNAGLAWGWYFFGGAGDRPRMYADRQRENRARAAAEE